MNEDVIAAYARDHLELIEAPDGGPGYRCSATLADGTFLACVLLASTDSVTELALRRFEESRVDAKLPQRKRRWGSGFGYPDIVRSFVARGNRVDHDQVAHLDKSRYAIPLARLKETRGETSMSWTQFVGVMKDGAEFGFGTTFLMEFFDMPVGYTGEDLVEIRPHQRIEPIHRERPYFSCYIKGI